MSAKHVLLPLEPCTHIPSACIDACGQRITRAGQRRYFRRVRWYENRPAGHNALAKAFALIPRGFRKSSCSTSPGCTGRLPFLNMSQQPLVVGRISIPSGFHAPFSGNRPGIQRDAKAAGKASRSGARLLSETSTPCSVKPDTTRRAWRSPVPTMPAASPRSSSPR